MRTTTMLHLADITDLCQTNLQKHPEIFVLLEANETDESYPEVSQPEYSNVVIDIILQGFSRTRIPSYPGIFHYEYSQAALRKKTRVWLVKPQVRESYNIISALDPELTFGQFVRIGRKGYINENFLDESIDDQNNIPNEKIPYVVVDNYPVKIPETFSRIKIIFSSILLEMNSEESSDDNIISCLQEIFDFVEKNISHEDVARDIDLSSDEDTMSPDEDFSDEEIPPLENDSEKEVENEKEIS